VPDTTLYLFDGYNLLHAGPFDDPRELVDSLASFVALRGARGVVVFDGVGRTQSADRFRFATPCMRTRCSNGSPQSIARISRCSS